MVEIVRKESLIQCSIHFMSRKVVIDFTSTRITLSVDTNNIIWVIDDKISEFFSSINRYYCSSNLLSLILKLKMYNMMNIICIKDQKYHVQLLPIRLFSFMILNFFKKSWYFLRSSCLSFVASFNIDSFSF